MTASTVDMNSIPEEHAYQGHVTDVEPHVGQGLIIGQGQRTLEARQRHVVLLRVEAAQTQVVEQLGVVHTHLQQASATEDEEIAPQCLGNTSG